MISSCTPEGQWNQCPCAKARCGSNPRNRLVMLLVRRAAAYCGFWRPATTHGSFRVTKPARSRSELAALAAERLGINPAAVRDGKWEELGIDSLDWVELVMELEEE